MSEMSEERFDAIVVGGGLAGLAAAHTLATGGLEVLLIEKGNYSGAKNVTGGRLYGHSLEKLLPDFAASAPLERRVVKERLTRLVAGELASLEYAAAALVEPAGGELYGAARQI